LLSAVLTVEHVLLFLVILWQEQSENMVVVVVVGHEAHCVLSSKKVAKE
jgi:hypothetical protein